MPVSLVVRASMLAYALPLLGLLVGAFLFSHLATTWAVGPSPEASAMTGAIAGLVLGLLASRSAGQRLLEGEHLPRFIRAVASDYE